MRDVRLKGRAFTFRPTLVSSKLANVNVETRVPPVKWIAVAPAAKLRKVIDEILKLMPGD
jgi:hypothetical protein